MGNIPLVMNTNPESHSALGECINNQSVEFSGIIGSEERRIRPGRLYEEKGQKDIKHSTREVAHANTTPDEGLFGDI